MNRIIRLPELIELTKLSRATIYLKIKAGEFPKPVNLGPRARGWLESDISDWIDSLTHTKQSA